MPRFALEPIPEITGKIDFYFLIIDGECQYHEFEEELRSNDQFNQELDKLQLRFQQVSEMIQPLSKDKFREITPKKETVKEYEAKTKNLRVYLIHQEKLGRIVILLGKKSNQKKDMKKFRSIKKSYLNTLPANT